MKQRSLLRLTPALAILLAALVVSCSQDDGGVTGPEGTAISPLDASYWPLPEGTTWSYLRVEEGVIDPAVDYFNHEVPAGDTQMQVSGTVQVGGVPARVLSSTTQQYVDTLVTLQHELDLWFTESAGGLELHGEDTAGATDSSYVFGEDMPYSWIRFGELRWIAREWDYSSETIGESYGGEEEGKILLSEAVGFEYPRIIYNGGGQPGEPYDPSDVDLDTYLDGIAAVRLVGEVIEEMDFAYADLGALTDSLFPQLKDIVYANCKWVRFSLEADLFLSNQRDPNAPPGQNSINEEYLTGFARIEPSRRDLSLMLLAPGVGPVVIVNYVDMDKQLKVGDPDEEILLFQSDLIQTDYLEATSLIP